ncbi:PDZ domain-containing protein [Pseudoxanthomonas daejeonensis]|uniref:PDZ domain-containing protein n=1 Tax=Pseudoxanthomonas daejeonensis TaxID=266062 RepID=A0ABQ6Z6G6_9GAMM|nr:PDZ domain-containing protein [Pseudoxanthomonas daejeonensis]KAF1693778.1 hypothetical protein CSC65_10865 [Pseudoxanthomonas daejeonensis]
MGIVFAALAALGTPPSMAGQNDEAIAGRAATHTYELGAVVDVRRASPLGLRVMAVTPGGAADHIGLRAGDMLQSVNGHRLDGDTRPATALAAALQAGAGALRIQGRRDGKPLTLSGSMALPGIGTSAGCGQLTSQLDGLPANSNVRRVDITQIEGRRALATGAPRHPVAAGTRVVILREHVPQPPARALSSYASKAFVLDIEPDTTYYVGARPLAGSPTGAWEPFVWQTLPEACR